jgi:hypothetical protein
MRLSAAAASILAIGLIVVACGGDEATPRPAPTAAAEEATAAPEEPTEEATAAPEEATEEATEPPAEEPTEEAAEEATEPPAEEAAAEPEFGKKAAISNEDDSATTFGLTSGRYRMQWSTTDCDQVDILVQQVDGEFSYPKPSRSSFASATINDLPEGTYTIEQLDPDCAEWSVRVDWMTN